MKTIPFDLEKALAGAKAWYLSRRVVVENVTRVGNRVAFTVPGFFDLIFQCKLDGTHTDDGCAVLALVAPEPQRAVAYHPVFADGRLGSGCLLVQNAFLYGTSQLIAVTTEQQEDGTWKIVSSEYVPSEESGQQ